MTIGSNFMLAAHSIGFGVGRGGVSKPRAPSSTPCKARRHIPLLLSKARGISQIISQEVFPVCSGAGGRRMALSPHLDKLGTKRQPQGQWGGSGEVVNGEKPASPKRARRASPVGRTGHGRRSQKRLPHWSHPHNPVQR